MKKMILTLVVATLSVVAFANETAVDFIKLNEGFKDKVYVCSAGKKTIGFGFTAKEIVDKGTITEEEATVILRDYVTKCKAAVKRLVKVKLTNNQEAVLIDFVFHFGSGAFANSTMLKKINAGQLDQVPAELSKWVKQKKVRNGKIVKVNGKIQYEVVQGLVNRANRRIALWNK